jgi:hypothetical protein
MQHRDAMMLSMRTTLNLPDDVYSAARSLAIQRNLSLGDAIGELVRNGLKNSNRVDLSKDFPCFTVSANAEPITMQHTLEIEDEW